MLVDAGLCALTCYAAIFLRLGFIPEHDTPYGVLVAISIALALPIFWALGLYREIFSQSGIRAIVNIARACTIYALPFATVFTVALASQPPPELEQIAEITGAQAFTAPTSEQLTAVYRDLGTRLTYVEEKRELTSYFMGGAAILLLLGAAASITWFLRLP